MGTLFVHKTTQNKTQGHTQRLNSLSTNVKVYVLPKDRLLTRSTTARCKGARRASKKDYKSVRGDTVRKSLLGA